MFLNNSGNVQNCSLKYPFQKEHEKELSYLAIASNAAKQSTCIRRQVGAVAVSSKGCILGFGWNGAPDLVPVCTEARCLRTQRKIPSGQMLHLCHAIHAEQQLVLQFGKHALQGSTVYITHQPCSTCFNLLLGCHIHRIVWRNPYPDEFALSLIRDCGEYSSNPDFIEFVRP